MLGDGSSIAEFGATRHRTAWRGLIAAGARFILAWVGGIMLQTGPRNLITDVAGLMVGNADDAQLRSGVTVLTSEQPFLTAVHVMGGAPGTRETDLLDTDKPAKGVDALVLSGGSALGLAAASGVADALRASGRGYDVLGQNVPIVPGAIIFDLLNGGAKDWSKNPYPALGRRALGAAEVDFALGTTGAGFGATTAGLAGGLGSASVVLPSGHTVGALAVVNALGSATIGETPHFWAAPWEIGSEFGGLGMPTHFPAIDMPRTKLALVGANTTIAIVATDATLTQAETKRIAVTAHDGFARALAPSHTPLDGDLVFAVATGAREAPDGPEGSIALGHAVATCMARAIARGVYAATGHDGHELPSWGARFGAGP